MNKKSTNRFISILNVIFLLIMCLFIGIDIIMDSYEKFSNKTEIGSLLIKLLDIRFLTLILAICVSVIMNIIVSIQNQKNKKLSITSLCIAITQLVIFIMEIYCHIDDPFMNDYVLGIDYPETRIFELIPIIISTIIIIVQLFFIYHQEDNNNNKNINLILNTILIILILISVLSEIIFVVQYSKVEKEITQYKDNIKESMKVNFEQLMEEDYFRVYEKGGWGYINKRGETVIPCIYDYISNFYEVSFQLFEESYFIVIAMKGNDYLLISSNNSTINLGENPLKWYEGHYDSPVEIIIKELFRYAQEISNDIGNSYIK